MILMQAPRLSTLTKTKLKKMSNYDIFVSTLLVNDVSKFNMLKNKVIRCLDSG
jgi:hypothetical protein